MVSLLAARSRRSIPASTSDDRTFAVRIRFAIPGTGFTRLPDLHAWLQARSERQFAIHAAAPIQSLHFQDCAFLYVNDLAIAVEAMKEFDLQAYGLLKQTP